MQSASGDAIVCMLTSGSVGPPKLVAYTWERVWIQANETIERLLADVDAFVVTTPVAHSYNMNGLLAAFLARKRICVAMTTADMVRCLAELGTQAAVVFACPPMLTDLLRSAAAPPGWSHHRFYSAGMWPGAG